MMRSAYLVFGLVRAGYREGKAGADRPLTARDPA